MTICAPPEQTNARMNALMTTLMNALMDALMTMSRPFQCMEDVLDKLVCTTAQLKLALVHWMVLPACTQAIAQPGR